MKKPSKKETELEKQAAASLNDLILETLEDAKEMLKDSLLSSSDKEMSEMYCNDAEDFLKIQKALVKGDFKKVQKVLGSMDSLPRDLVVDLLPDQILVKLGYESANGFIETVYQKVLSEVDIRIKKPGPWRKKDLRSTHIKKSMCTHPDWPTINAIETLQANSNNPHEIDLAEELLVLLQQIYMYEEQR